MTTVEVNVYKFDELSDEAKEKAREWGRNGDFDFINADEQIDETIMANEYTFDEDDYRFKY